MKNLKVTFSILIASSFPLTGIVGDSSASTTPHALESPKPGSTKSGIGLVRGWICDAGEVTVSFDNGTQKPVVYGNLRGDTLDACGDKNNGFELLWNWGLLEDGPHNIRIFADGVEIDQVDFNVVSLGYSTPFTTGLSGTFLLEDFPVAGETTEITWSEADQNFIILSSTHLESEDTADPQDPIVSYGVPGNPGGFTETMISGNSLYILLDIGVTGRVTFNPQGTADVFVLSGNGYDYMDSVSWHINETGGLWFEDAHASVCDETSDYIYTEGYSYTEYQDGSTEFYEGNIVFFHTEAAAIAKSVDVNFIFFPPVQCEDRIYDY
jgi:hypothetical protein